MKQRLENDHEYSVISAKQDPIRLWKKIEATSLHGSISTYQVKIVEDVRRRFEGVYQAPNETVAEFHRRFIGEINVMRSCGAHLVHVPFLPADPARRAEVQDPILKVEDAISAYRFLTKLLSMLSRLLRKATAEPSMRDRVMGVQNITLVSRLSTASKSATFFRKH